MPADVCIIGSGPGGSVVAKTLTELGFTVVLLERGKRYTPADFTGSHRQGWETSHPAWVEDQGAAGVYDVDFPDPAPFDPAMDSLRSFSAGKPLNRENKIGGVAVSRVFGLGGSTLHFQGIAERLHPSNFRIRAEDGVGIDWPLGYDDLAPYYKQAEIIQGVSGPRWDAPNPPHPLSYASQVLQKGAVSLGWNLEAANVAVLSKPYQGRRPCAYINGCVRGCPTGAKSSVDSTFLHAAENTGKLTILQQARAYAISVDDRGLANAVLYFDKDGKEQRQEARIVVLAAGAVETPRLLLHSVSARFTGGLANSSGCVGRGIMQTLYAIHVAVYEERLGSYRGVSADSILRDFETTREGHDFVRGFHMEISQAGIDLLGPNAYAGRLAPRWGKGAKDWMRRYFGNAVGIGAMGEMLPVDTNSVSLSLERKDRWGIPLPFVRLRLGKNDIAMIRTMKDRVNDLRLAAGANTLMEEFYSYDLAYGGGELRGGCRMGADPATSVVNGYCQSHDVRNLFITDASVFPSGGPGTPSLTIMAVAGRAAAWLAEEAKAGRLEHR